MSFSARWLDLRAAADARARSADLMARAAALTRAGAQIVDLGAGTGATIEALSPLLATPQRWTLVDADEALLLEAVRRYAASDRAVTAERADLSADPLPVAEADLVTASALFDLYSPHAIERFAAKAAAIGAPILALLTFDGRLSVTPPHPDDRAMIDAFHTHQRTDKGFGPAAGPDAADNLVDALAANGYTVSRADSAWHLTDHADRALMDELFAGWSEAAKDVGVPTSIADAWQAARRSAGTILVGHLDILAEPPPR